MVLAIVILYFAVCLALGLWARTKTKTAEDFLLAGRRLPWWVASAAIASTLIGSGVTIGVAELGHSLGVSGVLYPIALAIALLVSMRLAAARFRRGGHYTVPELLERYYGSGSRVLTAIVLVITFIPPLAAQYIAAGAILTAMTGIPLDITLSVAAWVIIFYIVTGGYWALAAVDVFQTATIYVGLVLLGIFVIANYGFYDVLLAKLPPSYADPLGGGPVRVSSYLGVMIALPFISQAWLQTAASVRKPEDAQKAGIAAALLVLPIGFLAVFGGLAAKIALPQVAPIVAVPQFIINSFPPIVGGLFCAGILAACMSSANAWVHSSSTLLTRDIYVRLINPRASDQAVLRLSVALCLAIGVATWLMSLVIRSEIVALVLLLVAPGALYIGPLLAAWFSPRKLTKEAGFAIMAIVAAVGLGLSLRPPYLFGVHPILTTAILAYVLTGVGLFLPWTSYRFELEAKPAS